MEEDNGRSFNCAESVLIRVNRADPLPNFSPSCMKVASVLGGGVSGFREICGAVSGGVICLGLMLGTTGDEDVEEFGREVEDKGIYKKITVQGGRVIGAIWMGTREGVKEINQIIAQKINVEKWKDSLLDEDFDFSVL